MVHKLTITYLLDKSQKYGIGYFYASIHLCRLNLSSSPCTCSCSRHLSRMTVPEPLAFLSSSACRCHSLSPGHLSSLHGWNPCCVTMLPSKATSLKLSPHCLLPYLLAPSSGHSLLCGDKVLHLTHHVLIMSSGPLFCTTQWAPQHLVQCLHILCTQWTQNEWTPRVPAQRPEA